MSLLAPWALVGLLALPAIWWLHRRLRRPPEVLVPSLLFLEGEDQEQHAPERRRLDPELLLALAAAALLVLAAVGPLVVLGPPGRTVRVVVASGVAGRPKGMAVRVTEAIRAVRDALGPSDRLVGVREPGAPTAPRPSEAALLDAARAGPAALRIVVSDHAPATASSDVRWIGVGDPKATNLGLVAASVAPIDGGLRLFANVVNDSDQAGRAVLSVLSVAERKTTAVEVAAGAAAGTTVDLAGTPDEIEVRVTTDDDFAEDDRVVFTRAPFSLRFDASVPPEHAAAVTRALTALLGSEGFRTDVGDPHLVVTTDLRRAVGNALVLQPLREGAVPVLAGPGVESASSDPLARDLTVAGSDLVWAEGAERPSDGAQTLLARRTDRPLVVLERRGSVVRLGPDPLLGTPPLVRTPFWPLFVENLVRETDGEVGPLGYRRVGVLDLATSRLGRARSAFDPAWLASAAPDLPARAVPLRPWLLGAALLALAFLWSSSLRSALASRGTRSRPRVRAVASS